MLDEQDVITLDDRRWEALIALTDGAAAPCFQCGVCTAVCPWALVRDGGISVRSLIRQVQLGLPAANDGLWLCTTCAQCQSYCPREVDIARVMRGLRYLAWEQRQILAGLPSLLWSIYWNNNPWSQPPSQRTAWARDLEVPAFDPARHEILYYVGCTPSYERRAQQVARALVQVLERAGVSFGTLGQDEPCCGEAALSVGHRPYFEERAQQTAQVLREHGVTRLVTTSPHCYDVFRNHYGPLLDGLEVLHYTQYLAQLLDKGRLVFDRRLDMAVTFHDACYLGRHNREYRAPRRILSAIPGLELIEMPLSGIDALCCGGGGGRMWLETAPGERFSDLRVREAMDNHAEILATSCPFCIVCLEDSAKDLKIDNLAVLDVAEIAALAMSQ